MSTHRVRVLATGAGVPVNNVFHVSAGDAPEQAVVNELANAWRAHIVPLLASTYVFQGIELENIATDDVGAYSSGTTGALTGGDTTTALPTFVCVSVRVQTERRGRAGQGRLGLGPITEAFTVAGGNDLVPSSRTAFQTAMTNFTADIAQSGSNSPSEMAVVSYYKGVDSQGKPIKRPTPLITPVTGFQVNSVLGTRLSRHPNR